MAVVSDGALRTGLSGLFTKTYQTDAPAHEWIKAIVEEVPSSGDTENHTAPETSPYFSRKVAGTDVTFDDFKFYSWSTKNLDWEKGVEWLRNSRTDDQTDSLFKQALGLGQHAAALPAEVVLKQQIDGNADPDLLDAIPNAPDGLATYSSSARFGISTGNIRTGSGVASDAAILTDFFGFYGDLIRMQDTKGKPYHVAMKLKNFLVLYRPTLIEVFMSAFKQKLRAKAATTATSNASTSNLLDDAELKVTPVPVPYFGTNDWYGFALDSGPKPFYMQVREKLRQLNQTEENSDRARRAGWEGVIYKMRLGFGADVPLATEKIDN